MKTTIICGFPGIGKTTCRYKYNNPNVLDSFMRKQYYKAEYNEKGGAE